MKKRKLTLKELIVKIYFRLNGINLAFYENPDDERDTYQPYATAFILGKPECPPNILLNWGGNEKDWNWKHWFIYESPQKLKNK